MAHWVLTCPDCKHEFTHCQVKEAEGASLLDAFSWIAGKPDFPEEGLTLLCPNCMQGAVYKRHELIYRTE